MSLSPLLALAMFLIQAFAPGTIQAQLQNPADMDVKCTFGKSVTTTGEVSSGTYMGGAAGNSITGTITGLDPAGTYKMEIWRYTDEPFIPILGSTGMIPVTVGGFALTNNAGSANFTINNAQYFDSDSRYAVMVQNSTGNYCNIGGYRVVADLLCKDLQIYQDRGADGNGDGQPDVCFFDKADNTCLDDDHPIYIAARLHDGGAPASDSYVRFQVGHIWLSNSNKDWLQLDGNGSGVMTWSDPGLGNYPFVIETIGGANIAGCDREIEVEDFCNDVAQPEQCITKPIVFTPGGIPGVQGQVDTYKFCNQITDAALKQKCLDCTEIDPNANQDYKGVWTAIGCIKREPEAIAQKLILIGLSTGGGVALLMSLAAGFMMTTSQGDPKRISDAKEMLTAAITGILFIIFSVTILQFIGFTVLKIPGFGG